MYDHFPNRLTPHRPVGILNLSRTMSPLLATWKFRRPLGEVLLDSAEPTSPPVIFYYLVNADDCPFSLEPPGTPLDMLHI